MDNNTLILLLVTIIGWFIVHFFEKRRDAINKRKEIRINYLIEAWRLLESASNRNNKDLNKNIETAIADIQLFGSKKQIEIAQQFVDEIHSSGSANSLNLLIELRDSLRKELDLEKVSDTFKFIRFKN